MKVEDLSTAQLALRVKGRNPPSFKDIPEDVRRHIWHELLPKIHYYYLCGKYERSKYEVVEPKVLEDLSVLAEHCTGMDPPTSLKMTLRFWIRAATQSLAVPSASIMEVCRESRRYALVWTGTISVGIVASIGRIPEFALDFNLSKINSEEDRKSYRRESQPGMKLAYHWNKYMDAMAITMKEFMALGQILPASGTGYDEEFPLVPSQSLPPGNSLSYISWDSPTWAFRSVEEEHECDTRCGKAGYDKHIGHSLGLDDVVKMFYEVDRRERRRAQQAQEAIIPFNV